MNLENIQSIIKLKVAAIEEFAPHAAAIIVEEDGTYPKTPGREAALASKGLCLTIWHAEAMEAVDSAVAGAASYPVYLPVVVEENLKVNRAAGGTGIVAEKAVRLILKALLGARLDEHNPRTALVVSGPPFRNFGTVNGVRRMLVNLEALQVAG